MNLDVAFLHPPAILSKPPLLKRLRFRRPPPPTQYLIMPMGLFSISALLEDNGFKVRLFNLGLEAILGSRPKELIKHLEADIYAIDLHWFVHTDGALKVAELCKKLHQNSLVVLGGLTATYFDLEILKKYPFVDVIIRGEGEESFLELVKQYFKKNDLSRAKGIKGLTIRINNKVVRTPPRPPVKDLDRLDFTRLDLLEHWYQYLRVSISDYIPHKVPAYWLTIGRGCPHTCIYCSGSAKSYPALTGRCSSKFRSPDKVIEDLIKLQEYGVKIIRFGQDIELAGSKYYNKVFHNIKSEGLDLALYNECWNHLPSSYFIRKAKSAFYACNIVISPDSASENVRWKAMRLMVSNKHLLKNITMLDQNEIVTDVYFLIGLPGETWETLKEMKKLAIKIAKTNWAWVAAPFPFTLEPGSPMFDEPEKYGIRLFCRTLEDYRKAFLSPDPKDWICHETENMTRSDIAKATHMLGRFISSLNQPGLYKKQEFEFGKIISRQLTL